MVRASLLVIALALGVPTVGMGVPAVVAEGTISLGHPASRSVGTAAEIGAGCNGEVPQAGSRVPQANGTDGWVFDVPVASRGKQATLTWTATVTADLDVFWFRANCAEVPGSSWRSSSTTGEQGAIPEAAVTGLVSAYQGAGISFSLRTV